MNNERRKQIAAIKERISAMQTLASEIKDDIEQIRDDEQEYYDNMPESMQGGEKGEKADAAITVLDDLVMDLDSLLEVDFDGQLDTAAE